MSDRYMCDVCGLCDTDLPDGVDADLVFDRDDRMTFCCVHSDADVAAARAAGEEA